MAQRDVSGDISVGPEPLPTVAATAPRSEFGVVLIELAASAMMFFILAAGTIDVSRMILTHIAFTQITREAVRIAAGNRNLEVGPFTLTVTGWNEGTHKATPACAPSCSPCYAYTGGPTGTNRDHHQHCLLLSMLYAMEARWSDYFINWTSLTLTSARYSADPASQRVWGPSNTFRDDDAVEFKIQATYKGFFFPFNGTMIRSQAVASIL